MYKYVLFDLDGTLTDSKEGIINSVAYALEKMGISSEGRLDPHVIVGPPLLDTFEGYYGFSPEKARQAYSFFQERYSTIGKFENRAFAHASDLTRFLKEHTDLEVAGACYPEKHFEAESLDSDITYLKEKQEAGAAFFITQLFFENDSFYRFLEKKNHAGITLPICAGIMPITSAKQLGTTVTLSGSSVPKELADIIATYGENPEDMRKAGIDYAIRQILDLKQHGADGIHIYSMNKPKTTRTIVEAIR